MTRAEKKGFHTVQETDMEDYRQKLREHRLKVFKRSLILILIVIFTFLGIGLYMTLRQYTDFDVRSSIERSDAPSTQFEAFEGNILKYSKDGAVYTDCYNELIWNQTFEMTNPRIDICENYLIIYDKGGTLLYIMTTEGVVGSIETTLPILQGSVASQGTVAVLLDNHSTGQLVLYDVKGTELASGAIHGEKGGYPIAIALSHDAIKLAVSMLDISGGQAKTTVAFYNFGSVGENEIDHIVSVNAFEDMVVPELDFVSSDRLVAYGDTSLLIFEGTQKPKLVTEVPLETEVRSFFHNESYIGIIDGSSVEADWMLKVYDMKGKLLFAEDLTIDYTGAEFLVNDDICIYNANACDFYTTKGVYKFHYEFENTLYKVLANSAHLDYTFVLDEVTEKVRLK